MRGFFRRYVGVWIAAVCSAVVLAGGVGIPKALDAMRTTEQDYDFVFLADKVGSPAVLVIFQVDPDGRVRCYDDGPKHQWERPWNMAVVNTAKEGDIIQRFHMTETYRLFGRTFWREHQDQYLPVTGRLANGTVNKSSWFSKWPFTFKDPRQAYWGPRS